jgi:exopolysaccharide biosynthesis WecB/TagA/CpsF family protein
LSESNVIDVMGLEIDLISRSALLDSCLSRKSLGMVSTPNTNFFVKASENSDLKKIFNDADIRVCDSRVVCRLSALLGVRLPLITGSDLVNDILRSPRSKDLHICLIGGFEGYEAKVSEKFHLDHFTQIYFPFAKSFTDSELAEFGRSVSGNFDLVFICLGAPLAERLATIMRDQARNRFRTILCVGASIDFLVGSSKRAPMYLQILGLEWLYRFVSEPKRLYHRYFIENPKILILYIIWAKDRLKGALKKLWARHLPE